MPPLVAGHRLSRAKLCAEHVVHFIWESHRLNWRNAQTTSAKLNINCAYCSRSL